MPPPRPVAGGLLWFRGRFTDRTGLRVVVGDTSRSAYVAEDVPVTPEWRACRFPPIAAPGSRSLIGLPFAEADETTGASLARAERWEESDFEGNWIVFRLAFADRGVEIGLPIVAGRQSQALFWIPLTWRGAGQLPAPPPMDPAERFDIRFSRFVGTDQRAHPWSQGYLEVPGLRAEIPKGWEPVANVRTEATSSRLAGSEGASGPGVPALSVWTVHDNLVAPQDSSRLAWANASSLHGVAHLAMLDDARVHRLVLAEIAAARAA